VPSAGTCRSKRTTGLEGRFDQRWATFVRNHAETIVACDLFTAVTTTFKILYVFVVIDHGTRKILHCIVTEHPSSEWTLQLWEAILGDHDTDS
jgi:hypothetical protein